MSPILLDSCIGIVILLSVIFAYFRGFVREVLTIVNLGGAAAAGYYVGPSLIPQFNKWMGVTADKSAKIEKIWGVVPPEIMAAFGAYAATFFGVFLILTLAGLYISGTVKAMGLGPADKGMGVVFGAARGFLLVFLCYLPFAYFMVPEQYPEWAKKSVSVTLLQDTYEYGKTYMEEHKEDMAHVERPENPDSIAGKLKRMADEMARKQPANGEPEPETAPEYPAPAEEEEILP